MTTPQRTCSKCRVLQGLENFPNEKGRKYGKSYLCTPCTADKYAKYIGVEENRLKKRAKEVEHHKLDPGREARYMRTSNLMRNYGINSDQWDEIFEAQGKKCKTCGSPEPRTRNGWHTDHCHEGGQIRGILCHYCNIALGYYEKGWEMPSVELFNKYKEESNAKA